MRLFSLLAGPALLAAAWLAACSSSDDGPGGIGSGGAGGSLAGSGGQASGAGPGGASAGAGSAGASGAAAGQGGAAGGAGVSGGSGQSGEAGESGAAGAPPGLCPSNPSGACTDEGLVCPDTGCPTAACSNGSWVAISPVKGTCGATCVPGSSAGVCTKMCTDAQGKATACSCVPSGVFDCPELPACPVCLPADGASCDPTGVATVPHRKAVFIGQGFTAYSGASVVGSGATTTACQPGTGTTTIDASGQFSLLVEGWGFSQVGIHIDAGSQQGNWFGNAPSSESTTTLSPADFSWIAGSGGSGGQAGTAGAAGAGGSQ